MKKQGKKRQVVGTVVSDKMDKTVVVVVERLVKHRLWKRNDDYAGLRLRVPHRGIAVVHTAGGDRPHSQGEWQADSALPSGDPVLDGPGLAATQARRVVLSGEFGRRLLVRRCVAQRSRYAVRALAFSPPRQ